MKKIILIAYCKRVEKINENKKRIHYKFRGVYKGMLLSKVILELDEKNEIYPEKEHLIYLEVDQIEKNTLFGKIKKIKVLDDISSKG